MSKEAVIKELTDGEKEVLRIKKDFLLSGVPEELRRQQNNQQTNVTFSEAPFPTTSHIQTDWTYSTSMGSGWKRERSMVSLHEQWWSNV